MKTFSQRGSLSAKSQLARCLLALVGGLILAAVVWLSIPLSPPNVSLKFIGYEQRGTNIYAAVCMSNEGNGMIWWGAGDWEVLARTQSGWITNRARNMVTSVPYGVSPASTETLLVEVPPDVLQWQVLAGYTYYSRHHLRYELVAWLIGFEPLKRLPPQISEVLCQPFEGLGWCLCLLPDPVENYGEILSPSFTNKPPIAILLPGQPKP